MRIEDTEGGHMRIADRDFAEPLITRHPERAIGPVLVAALAVVLVCMFWWA